MRVGTNEVPKGLALETNEVPSIVKGATNENKIDRATM